MPTIDELAAKYGNQADVNSTSGSSTIDDLASRYGGNSIETAVDIKPRVIAPPIAGATAEQSNEINSQQPVKIKTSLGDFGLDILNDYGSSVKKSFNEGSALATQGFQDLSSNKPASAVGNIALGGLGMVTSPLSGAIETAVEKPITKLTGSEDIGKRVAMVAGLGLPVAKIGSAVDAARPTKQAIAGLIEAIGPENIKAGVERLKANPRLSIADVFPAVQQDAQKLVVTEGKHQASYIDWIKNRTETAKGVTEDAYNATMGIPVNIVDKLDAMKASARKVGADKINPVVSTTGPVDLTPVIAKIDEKLKPGITSVISAGDPLPLGDLEKPLVNLRKFLTDDKSLRTDAQSLHQFQSALRAKADDLLNSTSGQDRQLGRALMDVRNQIVDRIDAAGTKPGAYKEGLSSYRDEMQIQDAFQKGMLFTKNKLGQVEDTPEFWEKWLKGASKEEKDAAREGARLAVDHQINAFKFGARKGQDIPMSTFNREKLELLFGKKETDALATKLNDERDIAETNSKLIHNSQTAMRLKSNSRIDLPENKGLSLPTYALPIIEAGNIAAGGIPGMAAGGIGALKASNWATGKVKRKLAMGRNDEYVNLITAEKQARDELIKALEEHIPSSGLTLPNKLKSVLRIAP